MVLVHNLKGISESKNPTHLASPNNVETLEQAQPQHADPHANSVVIYQVLNKDTQTSLRQSQVKNPGSYYLVPRYPQNTPTTANPTNSTNFSPLARWEHETRKEQPWNLVGEVYLESAAGHEYYENSK